MPDGRALHCPETFALGDRATASPQFPLAPRSFRGEVCRRTTALLCGTCCVALGPRTSPPAHESQRRRNLGFELKQETVSTSTQSAVPALAHCCSISGQRQLTRWEVACSVGTWRRAVAVVVGRSQEKRKYRACSFGAGLGATRTATQLTRSVDRGVRER